MNESKPNVPRDVTANDNAARSLHKPLDANGENHPQEGNDVPDTYCELTKQPGVSPAKNQLAPAPETVAPLEIVTRNGTALVDSRVIAAFCQVQHESLMRLIKEYQVSIEEGLGILRFEIGEIKGRGQPEKYALLTEDQATLIMTATRNTQTVWKFKVALVKAFRNTRDRLATHETQGQMAQIPQTLGQALLIAAEQRLQLEAAHARSDEQQ